MNNTGNYDDFINNNSTGNQNTKMTNTDNTGIGKLKIFVFTSNAALPVNGATVKVYTMDSSGNREVLYEMVSNFDGETEEVALATPNIDNSLSPFDQAFSIYYVSINHPDYNPVNDFAVQIFPNTITVLPSNLQPRSEVR